jgi:hypothetical protein
LFNASDMSDAFDPYLEWLGIEPHERPPDHYRLLGVARFEKDRQLIEAAADQRMAYVRGFQTGPRSRDTQKLLNELATAKICLLNPNTKVTYDAVLEGRLAATAASDIPAGPHALPHDLLPPDSYGTGAAHAPHATATAEPPRRGNAWRDDTSSAYPTPPPPPPHREPAAAASNTTMEAAAGEDAEPRDDNPIYMRAWFPFAVAAAIVVVAGLVWGIGRTLPKRAVVTKPPVEDPELRPEDDPPPVVVEPLPPDPVVINQEASGAINFPASVATLHGDNLQLQIRGSEGVIEGWTSQENWLSWEFKVVSLPANPFFKVLITYTAEADAVGGRYSVAVDDDKEVSGTIPSMLKPNEFHTDELIVAVSRTGRHRLTLRAKEKPGAELMQLKSISLEPVKTR